MLLNYASDQLDFENDKFTFTAPTEAFEDFQDWLRKVAESLSIRHLRLLDEPTACVLGYHGATSGKDRFVVFDFGCGTLDVSAVRIDLGTKEDRKAIQLGQAGRDIGGMDIDRWIAEDFCHRHRLDNNDRYELEAIILRQAEQTKIFLSDPAEDEATMTVVNDCGSRPRVHSTDYRRSCESCQQGNQGKHPEPAEACVGCLLLANDFVKQAGQTLDRALENAAIKAGVRREDVTKLLLTGGTSLVPSVRAIIEAQFDGRVYYQNPFDAVARGACRGIVEPILQHDYAIESYSRERKQYEFKPIFRIGTEFPTKPNAIQLWARGTYEGMTRLGLKIFEVSRMPKNNLAISIVDADGSLREDMRINSDFGHICLNPDNPTFIIADPPVNLQRDQKRFLCSFQVDGHRRLLLTMLDNFSGKTLFKDHPVVRL